MPPSSSTVACRALGLRLRAYREHVGLGSAVAAKSLGVTAAYLSEVEHGKKTIATERLDVAIDVYAIPSQSARELHVLRGEAAQRGWWNRYAALFCPDQLRYLGFEHGADHVDTFDQGLVNGLLQTEDYARAIIEAAGPNLRLAESEYRVRARLSRQRRLTGESPLTANIVLGESAVRQQVGGPRVLRDQLVRLAALIERLEQSVQIRIVPFDAGGYDALGGSSFAVLGFASRSVPKVLWQETATSARLICEPLCVREHSISHAEAARRALSRTDSLRLIERQLGSRERTTLSVR